MSMHRLTYGPWTNAAFAAEGNRACYVLRSTASRLLGAHAADHIHVLGRENVVTPGERGPESLSGWFHIDISNELWNLLQREQARGTVWREGEPAPDYDPDTFAPHY
jgi:hypothetical protein